MQEAAAFLLKGEGPSLSGYGERDMKKYIYAAAMIATITPALAGRAAVPEMSAGAGVAAIALLVGAAAIIRERMKK